MRDPTEGTSRSLAERVNTFSQEPLTPLTKTLLILALMLLLTSSVCLKHAGQTLTYSFLFYKIFIGLFAGAQHRLSLEHDGKTRTTVISATTTSTVTSAITSTVTSAITSTITSAITATVTSTTIGTTTVIPLPVPTKAPEEVRVTCSHDIRQHNQHPCFIDFVSRSSLYRTVGFNLVVS